MTETPSNSSPSPVVLTSNPSTNDSIISLTLPIATKLSDSNFLTWKSQILPLINGYNLTRFIDSSPSPPQTIAGANGSLTINPDFVTWHRQDQLLLAWIRSSLTELVQSQVVSCSTTADLWHTLSSNFSSSSRARLIDLRRQLQTISKGSLSCSDYLQRLRKIFDELAFIGSPVSDEDLVLSALNGLGPDFNSFVVAVTASSRNDPLRFSDLKGLLLGHEALLMAQQPSAITLPSLSSPSAFYTRLTNTSGYKPKPGYRPPKPNFANYPNPRQPNPAPLLSRPTMPRPNNPMPPRAPFNPTQYQNYKRS